MKPRILLVEDDEFIGVLVRTVLTNAGSDVSLVDRFEALESVVPFDFDGIVTDYQLPGADGCKVIGYAQSRRPGIRALLVSGHGDLIRETVANRGLNNVHFLNKPFRVEELLGKFAEMFPLCQTGEASHTV